MAESDVEAGNDEAEAQAEDGKCAEEREDEVRARGWLHLRDRRFAHYRMLLRNGRKAEVR